MTTPTWSPDQQRLLQRLIDTLDHEAAAGRIQADAHARLSDALADLAANVAHGDEPMSGARMEDRD